MRKLTKKSLDELAKTMFVIEEFEQSSFWGMYNNDCFWRCVAYMESGKFTESDAESYALNYYANLYGGYPGASNYADSYLNENGAGVSLAAIQSYIKYSVAEGSYSGPSATGEYIGYFYTNNIDFYEATSTNHAVIVKKVNSDGSLYIFDPQLNVHTTIQADKAKYVSRAMY